MGGRATSCKPASCDEGVRPFWLPNGLIIVDIALFSLFGVLLKLNARPTFTLVFDANLLHSKQS